MLFMACSPGPAETAGLSTLPADSILNRLIREKYTAQNRLDGAEFASIDSLKIIDRRYLQNTSAIRVVYYIDCNYQAAVRAPGFETGPPPSIHQIDSIDVQWRDGSWSLDLK